MESETHHRVAEALNRLAYLPDPLIAHCSDDDLGVLFWEAASLDSLTRRYKHKRPESFTDIPFPLLVVEVRLIVADAGMRLTRDVAQVGAAKMLGHGLIRSANGFVIT